MKPRTLSAAILGLALAAGASAPSLAQEKPTAQLQLGGTYQITNATPSDDGTVNLDFSATITNQGAEDVSGEILLRDFSDNDKVWARFGDNTIAAGGNVTVSGNVTVPKAVFTSWSGGSAPPVFIYAENSRGDVTMVNISLSRVATPAPGK
jgi:hypothetical protein